MNNSFETAETIIQDYKEGSHQQIAVLIFSSSLPTGRLIAPSEEPAPDITSMLSSLPGRLLLLLLLFTKCCLLGVVPTTFSDWKSIEEEERARVKGDKPREKIVSIEEMMQIIKDGREKNRT